jgi:hypothetical protein
MFEQMTFIPEAEKGSAKIKHFEMTKEESSFTLIRAFRDPMSYCPPGKYAKLVIDGQIVMSDTKMERDSNHRIGSQSHGKVLIAGLGIGMVLTAVLKRKEVKSVIVIEKNADVIDLVSPHFKHRKLSIFNADIFEWKPTQKFDTIYFDIWPDINTDNLDDIAKLHRRFSRYLNRDNPESWIDSWQRDFLISRRRQEKRMGW